MPRRATKIVATLGPASNTPEMLHALIVAGVNVVRLNFSHGKAQDHIDLAALVRVAAQRAGREVGIMADLQGPKIRVGKFAEGKVQLAAGEKFVLDASRTEPGDLQGVGLDYKELPKLLALFEIIEGHVHRCTANASHFGGGTNPSSVEQLGQHRPDRKSVV